MYGVIGRKGSCLTLKYDTWLNLSTKEKHSSLLFSSIVYEYIKSFRTSIPGKEASP